MKMDSPELKLKSSFLSCEKDYESVIRKLFVENEKVGERLKSLLIVNTSDCLDNLHLYRDKLSKISIAEMKDKGYLRIIPKISQGEFEEVKSYLLLSYNDFTTNRTNPQFRDSFLTIDVLCHTDTWDLGDYRLRPLKICGYIDALLNGARLSGIGQLLFSGCKELLLDETLSGYTLMYEAVHGTDDIIPTNDEEEDE